MYALHTPTARFLHAHDVPPRDDWTDATASDVRPPVSFVDAVRHAAEHLRRTRPAVTDALVPRVFTATNAVPTLPATLHDHQREALACVVGPAPHVLAQSGVIKAPCGSGKTLIGVAASIVCVARTGRGTLVLAPTTEACHEWCARRAMLGGDVRMVGSGNNSGNSGALRSQPAVVVTTYATLARATCVPVARLSPELALVGNVWSYGLLVLDEVWTLPATTYVAACARVPACVRLGLTADERRCDGREGVVASFVGPVLYAVSPDRARAEGVIARVEREVVVVATSAAFQALHARVGVEARRVLAALNPQKMHALRDLLDRTPARKVLVYCDKLAAVPFVRDFLGKCCCTGHRPMVGVLTGSTRADERARVCREMKTGVAGVALFSRVGNASIDLPDVELLVEVSVVDASVQQKTQRDGRAQRACEGKVAARVVTLVSKGTREEVFARTRARRDGDTVFETRALVAMPACPWDETTLTAAPVRGVKRARDA